MNTKKLYSRLIVALAASGCALPVVAAIPENYEMRWPVKGPVSLSAEEGAPGGSEAEPEVPASEPVVLSLGAAGAEGGDGVSPLPPATLGQFYDYYLAGLLTIEGDDPPPASAIGWRVEGDLPAGLQFLSSGALQGTPSSVGSSSFEVIASYEGAEGRREYLIVVENVVLRVRQVAAGYSHTCAVTVGGGVKCWGQGNSGQLGHGKLEGSLTPVDVVGLTSGVASIDTRSSQTCAVTTDGGAMCWGANVNGQLGNGTTDYTAVPVGVTDLEAGVSQISVGGAHTCAVLTTGGVKCWGRNDFGQVGDGFKTQRVEPVNVSGLSSGIRSVAAGDWHTCALTTSGGVKCWGNHEDGRLGSWFPAFQLVPQDVPGLSGVSSIAAGTGHMCALTTGGGVKCWGLNNHGQVGIGSTTSAWGPANLTDLESGVAAIDAAAWQTCAALTNGSVKCWGYNNNWQLGDGTRTNRTRPVSVLGLAEGAVSVDVGMHHACAQLGSGRVQCWGINTYGQIGDGTKDTAISPAYAGE